MTVSVSSTKSAGALRAVLFYEMQYCGLGEERHENHRGVDDDSRYHGLYADAFDLIKAGAEPDRSKRHLHKEFRQAGYASDNSGGQQV